VAADLGYEHIQLTPHKDFIPHPDDFVEDGLEAIRIIRGLNSKNVGFVYVACHSYHMGHPMREIMRAAGDKLRLVHVAKA
jgi:myo-inositol catabolism protein IolH